MFHERGDVALASKLYDQLLASDFSNTSVLLNYAIALIEQGKTGLAANLFARAAECNPPKDVQAMALAGIANCFRAENKYKEAEQMYRMSLDVLQTPETWSNLGGLFTANGTPHKAIECYEKALKLNPPNDRSIRFNLAIMYLELGLWEKGFTDYHKYLADGAGPRRQYMGIPFWSGEECKTLICYGDQGLGDEIMNASVLPDAARISKKIIFDCHPRLEKTFKRTFPEFEVHGTRKNQVLDWVPSSGAEYADALSCLPRFFRKKDEDFPRTPYLKADPEIVKKHREGSTKLRIGLSWKGGHKRNRSDVRSMPLEELLPILKHDAEFYSLQYTPDGDVSSSKEVCELEEKHGIRVRHYPGLVECEDYDNTINFIASMDLVISVCTTVIHASGALGVPCWILTPSKPAWRYGLKGERHTWYGSVRMFRQKPGETWAPVIHKISEELCAFKP